jgi:hypothetical protein
VSDEPEYTKHTTHTDALDTLGSIISPAEARDAIHLAVYPVEAARLFEAGAHVKLDEDGRATYATGPDDGIGIVDPFLIDLVEPGDWFWLVVYPRQISSLRHVWEHPSFPASGETGTSVTHISPKRRDQSEAWLRNFIASADCPDFDVVIAAATVGYTDPDGEATGHVTTDWEPDGALHFNDMDAHGEIPPEFWDHLEVYTGIKAITRATYFSCSC